MGNITLSGNDTLNNNGSSEEGLEDFLRDFDTYVENIFLVSDVIIPIVFTYIAPFIFFIGIAGNVLSLLVFSQKEFRDSVASVYFRALAVTDIMVLISNLFVSWLKEKRIIPLQPSSITFEDDYHAFCFLVPLVKDWSHHLSGALISAIAIDRYIAVKLPHQYKSLCTKKRAVFVTCVLIIILFGVNSPVLAVSRILEQDDGGTVCQNNTSYEFFNIIRWIEVTFYCIIPLTILLFCNVQIIIALSKASTKWAKVASPGVTKQKKNKSTSVTFILIGASVGYLLCTFPYFFSVFYLNLGDIHWTEKHNKQIINFMSVLLFNVNSASNFWLYLVSGSIFRQALWKLVKCKNS